MHLICHISHSQTLMQSVRVYKMIFAALVVGLYNFK